MEGFSVNLNQKYALSSTKIRNTVWNIQSYYGFFFSSMIFLFVLQEVLQLGVGLYALQLVSDNFPDLGTDTVVVILVHLLHAVVAASICKVRDDGYRPSSRFTFSASTKLPGLMRTLSVVAAASNAALGLKWMSATSGTEAAMSAHIERTIKPKDADEFNIDGVSHVNWFKRKTSLWKHWEYRQGYKIGVLTCKSIQSP